LAAFCIRSITPFSPESPLESEVTTRFTLPSLDDNRAKFEKALAALNAIQLTADQLERGNSVFVRTHSEAAVEAFCEAEGLLPADVAATAIMVRYGKIVEAQCNGIPDPKTEMPEIYELFVSGPLGLSDLGFDEFGAEADEEEIATLQ
jgi:hypothetical protein